jgi:polysaccharide biosynthesis protein PslG
MPHKYFISRNKSALKRRASFLKHRRLLLAPVFLLLIAVLSFSLIIIHRRTNPTPTGGNKIYGIALGQNFVYQPIDKSKTQLHEIKQAGFASVRFLVSWNIIQPQNSKQYVWTKYDQIFEAVHEAGLKPLAIISFTPLWARSSNCLNSAYCSPKNVEEFADFAGQVAKRYSPDGLHQYEIWNEPNVNSAWLPSPSPSGYAALLKATYPVIKHVDPKSIVLTGGMADVGTESAGHIDPSSFLESLYELGIKNYSDGIAYHPYTFPQTPDSKSAANGWAKMSSTPNSLRQIMVRFGDSKKKIWITEFGAPTNGPGKIAQASSSIVTPSTDHVSYQLQALMATQALQNVKKDSWVEGFFWYTWQDQGQQISTNENFYGLLDFKGNPKPSEMIISHQIN